MSDHKDDLIHDGTVDALRTIMAALRTPVTGCPWDLEQDFSTIAPYTIEEAYEVADAIARDDLGDLREELGDLLLQVVFHAQMAEERDAFDFDDVVRGICEKLIRRHPHVFGDEEARTAGAVKDFWERIKDGEKAEKAGKTDADDSVLAGVPLPLPALTRAVKLQSKAARVGFDWPDTRQVFDKLAEETAELSDAMAAGNAEAVFEEMGDLLFVYANLARHLKVDPESALRAANDKFARRFRAIETALAADGRAPRDSTLDEMDRLWDEAKAREKS
jgi:MazG family protein